MHTFPELIKAHQITMSCEKSHYNPHMTDDHEMDHWSILIHKGKQSMHTHYSTGIGHRELPKNWLRLLEAKLGTLGPAPIKRYTLAGEAKEALKTPVPPQLKNILNCLVLDASFVQDGCFEDFADNLGYSPDSIKARDTYLHIVEDSKRLKRLLGHELFNTMLTDTEWL